jgi:hypothetical protein
LFFTVVAFHITVPKMSDSKLSYTVMKMNSPTKKKETVETFKFVVMKKRMAREEREEKQGR